MPPVCKYTHRTLFTLSQCRYWVLFLLFRYFKYTLLNNFQYLFVRSFVRSFICSFVHLFVRSFFPWFICSLVHLFVRSFVRSFICSFVRSFVCLFVSDAIIRALYICLLLIVRTECYMSSARYNRPMCMMQCLPTFTGLSQDIYGRWCQEYK